MPALFGRAGVGEKQMTRKTLLRTYGILLILLAVSGILLLISNYLAQYQTLFWMLVRLVCLLISAGLIILVAYKSLALKRLQK